MAVSRVGAIVIDQAYLAVFEVRLDAWVAVKYVRVAGDDNRQAIGGAYNL